MARTYHRKARKDYPENGIAKGDMYYYAKIKTGPYSSRVIRQKEPIKPSQMTSSEYLSALYSWQESLEKCDDLETARTLAEEIRTLGEEQTEKFDNMPEGLQQGDTGRLLEERASACESAADEMDGIVEEWESAEETWSEEIETYKTDLEDYESSVVAYEEWEAACDELEEGDQELAEPTVEAEPDLPENTEEGSEPDYAFDASEWVERAKEVSVD